MFYLTLKALISGVLIAAASTVAKRYPGFGALIASLPLVSVLGMLWLWGEKPDRVNMAAHVQATFWYVLPSLPMFLVIPALLRHGLPKLADLVFQRLYLVGNFGRDTSALAAVDLRLLHPLMQRLRHATDLLRDRHHR